MPMTKIAVTVDREVAKAMDRLVETGKYPSRSKVVQDALDAILRGEKKRRLAAECAKLDPTEERALAEESHGDTSWPEY